MSLFLVISHGREKKCYFEAFITLANVVSTTNNNRTAKTNGEATIYGKQLSHLEAIMSRYYVRVASLHIEHVIIP